MLGSKRVAHPARTSRAGAGRERRGRKPTREKNKRSGERYLRDSEEKTRPWIPRF